MAEESPARLRVVSDRGLVDESTGELVPECDQCQFWQDQAEGKESELRVWRSKYADLRRDRDREMREHGLYPKALALFRYWQWRFEHPTSVFSPDRFAAVEPFLRKKGLDACVFALDALFASDYHMKRGAHANRPGPRYDEFTRVFSGDAKGRVPSWDTFEKWERTGRRLADARATIRGATMIDTAEKVGTRIAEIGLVLDPDVRKKEDESDPRTIALALTEIYSELTRWSKGEAVVVEEPEDEEASGKALTLLSDDDTDELAPRRSGSRGRGSRTRRGRDRRK